MAHSQTGVELSIVLPCFNEAENLPSLIDGYRRVWVDLPAELILVDNGSTDDTAIVLERELSRRGLGFARSVRVPSNRGYGHGILTGLRAARGKVLAYSHADMQCSPADLFRAYDAWCVSTDRDRVLVKGRREPFKRSVSSILITSFMGLLASVATGYRLSDINAQPKLFPRALLDELVDPPLDFNLDVYLVYRARRAGYRIETIPVAFGRRAHGQSKWAATLRSRLRTMGRSTRYILGLSRSKGLRDSKVTGAGTPEDRVLAAGPTDQQQEAR